MKWYPTPSYLLKRKIIIDSIQETPARTFLEVGCGAGDLLHSLDGLGYSGTGIDISTEAIAATSSLDLSSNITVLLSDLSRVHGQFDAVIASEVMEHWQDDSAFLMQLRGKIADDGWLFLTVPAHMKKWDRNDDICGHVRRYERHELQEKLAAAGFTSIRIFSYGVPLYNLMKPLYNRAIAGSDTTTDSEEARTKESGGMRLFTGCSSLFALFFNDITMIPFYLLQRLFFSTDLGNGYFVSARKGRTQD